MIVISHRGFWLSAAEKNTRVAFDRSFNAGFGTETDVRDRNGQLVIAHDVPTDDQTLMSFDDFLSLAKGLNQPLAINIKSDGLASLINKTMHEHGITNWFVFDMSVPDMRQHLAVGNPTFARMSEVEREPAWADECAGIWLDGFEGSWFKTELIEDLLNRGKYVCIVSPELHHRAHLDLWQQLREVATQPKLILCTDLPCDARIFFEGKT